MYNLKISVYGLWCVLQVRLWYFIIERIIIISTDKHGFIIRRDIVIRRDNIGSRFLIRGYNIILLGDFILGEIFIFC